MATPDVPAGWYRDPLSGDAPQARYWDGQRWTPQTRISSPDWRRGTPEDLETEPIPADDEQYAEAATPPEGQPVVSPGQQSKPVAPPVRLPEWFWVLLVVATLGILWGAAEQHDQGCYNKAAVQVASGNLEEVNCLILPWNDPATP